MARLKGSYNICKNITKEDWETLTTNELCEKYGAKHRSTINKYAASHNISRPKVIRKTAQNSKGYHYSDITKEDWETLTVSEICRKYKFRKSSLYRYIERHKIITHKKFNYKEI